MMKTNGKGIIWLNITFISFKNCKLNCEFLMLVFTVHNRDQCSPTKKMLLSEVFGFCSTSSILNKNKLVLAYRITCPHSNELLHHSFFPLHNLPLSVLEIVQF